MEIFVLDTTRKAVGLVENYASLIWTERYCGYGDFEIFTPITSEVLTLLNHDYYLQRAGSDNLMIIERIEIVTNPESGNQLLVSGRSLESLLDRRIVWDQTAFNTANLQTSIQTLLNQSFISPTNPDRDVSNFIFEASVDPIVTALTFSLQNRGSQLYDVIKAVCEANNLGFRITLTTNLEFKFKLYAGVNRSYDQFTNPYVIFSPNFENIINSNYISDKKRLKTISLVVGAGDDPNRKSTTASAPGGAGTGLARREMFTDAGSISQTYQGGSYTDTEYFAQLQQKGLEDLSENIHGEAFEGQVDTTNMYVYEDDFFLGDIVQIVNEYGMEGKSRITEFIMSHDQNGIKSYPTFKTVE